MGSVQQRFIEVLRKYPRNAVALCYHGTPEANFQSIFDYGLLPSGTHGVRRAHGTAYGHGVYVAKEDNPGLSRSYAHGSRKLLICALIDSTVSAPLTVTDQAASESGGAARRQPKKWVRRGGAMAPRSHPQPARAVKAPAAKPARGRQSKYGDAFTEDAHVLSGPGFFVARN